MDRRKFIKTIGATAGATLLSGTGIATATELLNDKTDNKMKIVVLTGSPRRNGNTNHLAGQIKGNVKQSALLMAYADTASEEAEPMLSHYHTLLRYLGWKDRGTVVAAGMWPTGAVNGTEYSRQAYELGRECFG